MSENSENTKSSVSSGSTAPFPPIKELLAQSWEVLTKSILNLFIINIVAGIGFLILAVVLVIGIIAAGGGVLLKLIKPELGDLTAPAIDPGMLATIGLFSVFIFLLFFIVGLVLQAGSILIVDKYQEKISFGEIIKKSIGLIIPLFLVNLLMFVIYIGATFVFIIPAILFYFLFTFVDLEIVLEKQGWIKAIRRSVFIVVKNFGPIFVRLLVVLGIYIVATVFIPNLVGKADSAVGAVFGFFSFFVNILLGWYVLAYTITLYKQARERAGEGYSSLVWIWVVAILGWVIAGIMLFAGYQLVSSGVLNDVVNKFKTQSTVQQPTNKSDADELMKSGNIKLQTAFKMGSKKNLTDVEKDQIISLIDQGLKEFNKATQEEPGNYQVWYETGNAYKSLIGIATKSEDSAIKAFKEAIYLNPKDYLSYLAIGGVYYQLKDYSKAVIHFEKAVEIKPDYANGFYNLGAAYKQLGDKVEARKAFEKALELLPKDDPTRNKAEAELKGL